MDAAATIQMLLHERDIRETVTQVFVGTDRRDWKMVEACFSETVTLDMSSLTGGAPARLTPSGIAVAWATGLAPIDHAHHQLGNFLIEITGNAARASCYGIALHHRKVDDPRSVRRFVGSYDVRLTRRAAAWKIDSFTFEVAFVDGNLELEKAT